FTQDHVGRALFTADVNRDGRNDVLITHMDEQARLLINQSEDENHQIAFQLVGSSVSRDAIGAVVRFTAGGRSRTLWSLAGDGYMCANERLLRAGLGTADQIKDLTIAWPDGTVDSIGTLNADTEYLVVQGDGQAFELSQY
ncbi:MAG: RNA-binding protein, partial [Pirellulaceae bacterium]|nr:RNA-binding protein [Pirellulaceae bacterium]